MVRNIRQIKSACWQFAFYGILRNSEDDGEERKETEEEEKLRLGVTPELVQSYIRHAEDCCEELIKLDELLVGKLANVKQKKPSELRSCSRTTRLMNKRWRLPTKLTHAFRRSSS